MCNGLLVGAYVCNQALFQYFNLSAGYSNLSTASSKYISQASLYGCIARWPRDDSFLVVFWQAKPANCNTIFIFPLYDSWSLSGCGGSQILCASFLIHVSRQYLGVGASAFGDGDG